MSAHSYNGLSSTQSGPQGSLRTTGLLAFLPISIISIILVSSLIYLRARNVIENQVNAQLNANLEALQIDFGQWLTTKQIRLDLAVRQDEFRTALENNLSNLNRADEAFLSSRETILAVLKLVTQRGEELLFNQFFIATPDGKIWIASEPQWEMGDISQTVYYRDLFTSAGTMVVDQPAPLTGAEIYVLTSVPFLDADRNQIATIFGVSSPISLINLLEGGTRFNPNAQSYLLTQTGTFVRIDPYQKTLSLTEPFTTQAGMILPMMEAAIQAGTDQAGQIIRTTTFDGAPVIADFSWLPAMKTGIVVEMPTEVAFGELNALGPYILAVTLVLGGLVFGFIWIATQRLVGPLEILTQAAQSFARGQWEQRAPAAGNNEIGQLSLAFNRMADDLSSSYQSLEAQVLERTVTLEKRSQQLQATAVVAREAASIRNLDELLTNLTHLISEQFGYYHTGIFLLDDNRRYAILQAANSPGGQAMLARSHRLEVGQVGVVGHVASTGLSRIALDVGTDAFFFDNPDLPDTRSELALPLKVRDQVIGVLDVQSTQPSAFEGSDVEVLQIMADQISLSIENARLLEQSQEAFQQLQRSYGSQLGAGWTRWLRNRVIAYSFDRIRLSQASADEIKISQELSNGQLTVHQDGEDTILVVPIQLRDQNLGSILLRRDTKETAWTPVDLELVSEATQQIALALENARLLDETTRRAEHEQTVSDFATQIAQTIDIDSILRTAVSQLGQLPNVADVSVHLGNIEGN